MIITFSGVDCAGKTTQITRLTAWLEAAGRRPHVFWHRPGYSPELDFARATVRRLRSGSLPAPGPSAARDRAFESPRLRRTWTAVALLDTLAQYALKVRALSAAGRTVVCDRYLADAFLDLRLRFPELDVERWPAARLLRSLTPRPDVALLLMLPRETVAQRIAAKAEPFPDPPAMRERRHAAYERLAASGDFRVIDADGTPDAVFQAIVAHLPAR